MADAELDAEWEARKPAPGTHVSIRNMFSEELIAFGTVVECVDGLTDFGGPESGPSVPSESIHVRVRIEKVTGRYRGTVRYDEPYGQVKKYDISQIEVIS